MHILGPLQDDTQPLDDPQGVAAALAAAESPTPPAPFSQKRQYFAGPAFSDEMEKKLQPKNIEAYKLSNKCNPFRAQLLMNFTFSLFHSFSLGGSS